LNIKKNLYRLYYALKIRVKVYFTETAPVIVWQMGKVGSSTLKESIEKSELKSAVFHVHLMNSKSLMTGELYRRSVNNNNFKYVYNEMLFKYFAKTLKNKVTLFKSFS